MGLKQHLTRSVVIAGVLLSVFLGFNRVAYAGVEVIENFDAQITVQKTGGVLVTETIVYDFGTNQRHGIFRDIPLTSVHGPQLSITVSGVRDDVGRPYRYTTAITNNMLQIKIGDPNALVSGVKTYVIDYQVYNTIRTFNDHDELYWNVTGNQWRVPISNAIAAITLPDPAITNATMDCFTGPQGSTQKNCTVNGDASHANYATNRSLNIGSGLTVVLGLPRGFINNVYVVPTASSRPHNGHAAKGNWVVFIPIFFVMGVSAIVQSLTRRSARMKPTPVIPKELRARPVVIEYAPPDHLLPIEMGTLLDRRVDMTDISSVIMDLAVRGYLKIRYTVEQMKFWPDKKDFELIRLKGGSDLSHPADKIMFDLLFSGGDRVTFSDLQQRATTFQADIQKIRTETEQHMHDAGYFDQAAADRSKKLVVYLGAAIFLLFIGCFVIFFLASIFSFGHTHRSIMAPVIPLFIISSVLVVLLIVRAVSRLAHQLTPQGLAALAKILGFRAFLQLTEKDQLQRLNASELQPDMFEKFLPYAMVLGVEDTWARKFEGIYRTAPHWYEDPTTPVFSSYVLTRHLGQFDTSFNRVFNVTSPTSSSGFSGGSSGGGSGGGGGGSW